MLEDSAYVNHVSVVREVRFVAKDIPARRKVGRKMRVGEATDALQTAEPCFCG